MNRIYSLWKIPTEKITDADIYKGGPLRINILGVRTPKMHKLRKKIDIPQNPPILRHSSALRIGNFHNGSLDWKTSLQFGPMLVVESRPECEWSAKAQRSQKK